MHKLFSFHKAHNYGVPTKSGFERRNGLGISPVIYKDKPLVTVGIGWTLKADGKSENLFTKNILSLDPDEALIAAKKLKDAALFVKKMANPEYAEVFADQAKRELIAALLDAGDDIDAAIQTVTNIT